MKKLDIHRNIQEPTSEAMKEHMNFDEVLKRSKINQSSTPKSGSKSWWWIGGSGVALSIVAIWFLINQKNVSTPNYESQSIEMKSIVEIEPLDIPDVLSLEISVPDVVSTTMNNHEQSNSTDTDQKPISKVVYLEPKLVSSIPFVFDDQFNLEEQYQQFEELSIYKNMSFMPIDKAQQSMLKLSWDSVTFHKSNKEQYYLILYKMGQGVICPVSPVFEEDHFVEALKAYNKNK